MKSIFLLLTISLSLSFQLTAQCENDVIAPVANCPMDMTIECDETIPEPIDYDLSWTDNCDETLDLTFYEEIESGFCPNSFVIMRTWTATDDSGNIGSCSHVIQVMDTTPPDLTIGDDVTVNSMDDIPAPDFFASDNCSEAFVTIIFDEFVFNSHTIITRIYTATDDCGNSVSDQQTITVITGEVQPNCHPDYDALIALYNSTNGNNWTNNSGWIDGAAGTNCEPCSWYGVICDASYRVIRLELQENQLSGNIPPEIGELTNLLKLSLYLNDLSGTIPAEIGDLSYLNHLWLNNNQFSGNLPSGLGLLTNLNTFYLNSNQFSGNIPPEIGNLSNLTQLYLYGNILTGDIPEEIGGLINLTILNLSSNSLSGEIPSELGDLSNLTWLNIRTNQLTGSVPPELGNLNNLTSLSVRDNLLTGPIPEELGNLSNIESLYLYGNQFSGCIPSSFHNFCQTGIDVFLSPSPLLVSDDFEAFCEFDTGECTEEPGFTINHALLSNTIVQPFQIIQENNPNALEISITNTGNYNLESLELNWTVNGISQPVINWTGQILVEETGTIELTPTIDLLPEVYYDIQITGSNPNGTTIIFDPNIHEFDQVIVVNPTSDHLGILFDGINDKIFNDNLVDFYNNFTVEFWINPEDTHQIDSQSNNGDSGTEGQHYILYPEYGLTQYGDAQYAGLGVSVGTNGISLYEHSLNYLPAILVYESSIIGWNHVAIVVNSGQASLFLNGKNVATGSNSNKSRVYPSTRRIGGNNYGFFNGKIDELRLWNDIRSEEEIKTWMVKNEGIENETGLVNLWSFGENNGTIVYDPINNSNGTLVDGASFISSQAPILDPIIETIGELEIKNIIINEYDKNLTIIEENTSYTTKVDVKNSGTGSITAIDFEWTLNNVTNTEQWVGNLLSNETLLIDINGIPFQNLITGETNVLTIDVININGNTFDGESIQNIVLINPQDQHQALDLDNTNEPDYIYFPNVTNLPVNNESFSIELWTKNNTESPHRLVAFGNATYRFGIGFLPDQKIVIKEQGTELVTSESEINGEIWTHIAATFDGSTLKLYVNGILEGQTIINNPLNYSNNIYIGFDPNDCCDSFDGEFDEIRIWDYARTIEEIKQNLSNLIPPNESSGLLFNLHMQLTEFNFTNNTIVESQSSIEGELINIEFENVSDSGAPVFDDISNSELDCHTLFLTDNNFAETSDYQENIETQLGTNYDVADWNDLNSLEDIQCWIDCFEIEEDQSFLITRNGNKVWSSNRHYFVRYSSDGIPGGGFLAHDNIDEKLWLGSWYNLNMKILGKCIYNCAESEEICPNNTIFNLSLINQSLMSSCSNTSAEPVTFNVKNVGLNDISSFSIGYILNGVASTLELFDTIIHSGETLELSMSQTVNIIDQVDNEFVLFISSDLDEDLSNDTLSTSITNYPDVNINISQDTTICAGSELRVQGSGATYYNWTGDLQGANGTSSNLDISPIINTTYFLTGSNEFGCSASDSVLVSINPLPDSPIIESTNTSICAGDQTILIGTNFTDNMIWNTGIINDSLIVIDEGWYTLFNINPSTNCVIADSIQITFGIEPSVDFEVFTSLCAGDLAEINAINATTANWTVSGSTISTNLADNILPATDTTTIVLNATSSDGCGVTDSITFYILQNTTIGNITGLFPITGSTDLEFDQILSWMPVENASLYDLYLWESTNEEPTSPSYSDININNFTPTLAFNTDYLWKITAKNSCNSATSEIHSFSTKGIMDLTISINDIPESTVAGSSFPLEIEVINDGNASTGDYPFIIYFAFSSDGEDFRLADDIYVLEIPNLTYLLPGQSYTQTVNIDVPSDINGTWFLFASVDNQDAYCWDCEPEWRGCHCIGGTHSNESNEYNNATSEPIFIAPAPSPDLVAGLVGGANIGQGGSEYTIAFVEINQGNFLVNNSRKHKFYASLDDNLSPAEDEYLGGYTTESTIQPGGADTSQVVLNLSHTMEGLYNFYVILDANEQIEEFGGENNNTGSKTDPVNVTAPALPNLTITELNTPSTAYTRSPLSVSGTGINIGAAAPYENSFKTKLYVCPTNTFDTNCFEIDSQNHSNAQTINPTDEIPINLLVNEIADTLLGNYYLVAKVDALDQVYEATNEDDNFSQFFPIEFILSDTVDLSISSPTNVLQDTSGTYLSFDYNLLSNGNDLPYNNCNIQIRKSTSSSFGNSNQVESYTIEPSEWTSNVIPKTFSYFIPYDFEGSLYFKIITDQQDANYEHNAEDNNESIIEYDITLSAFTDLTVDSVLSTTQILHREDQFTTSYIINSSTDWPVSPRTDRVRYCHYATCFDTIITILEGDNFVGSQQYDIDMIVPADMPYGNYHLTLTTDDNNQIFENMNEANNTSTVYSLITIVPEYTDFQTTIIDAPTILYTGNSGLIDYLLENIGSNPSDGMIHRVEFYLSEDEVYSDDDTFLTEQVTETIMNPSDNFVDQISFDIAQWTPPGAYYLLAVFNPNNTIQNDNNADNNVASSPITIELTDPSNLIISSTFNTIQLIAGQPLTLDLLIENIGIGNTVGQHFYSGAVINNSPDFIMPIDDLASNVYQGVLQAGNSYSTTLDMVIPPYLEGNYYIVIKVDQFNHIFEYEAENDNLIILPVLITAPQPADLTPSSFYCQSVVILGETFDAQVTIVNNGTNAAVGNLGTILSASSDNVLGDDIYLDDQSLVVNIAAGDSITLDFTQTLTSLTEGIYQLAANTNSLAQVPETDFTNNNVIDLHTFEVQVNELMLDIIATTTLDQGDRRYYKIIVPEDNLDLLITLESLNQSGGYNEMYIAKDRIPSELDFDSKQLEENEVNIQALMPSVLAGTYYIMAVTNTAFPYSQEVELLARALPFGITEVTPNVVGQRDVTTTIFGAGFNSLQSVFLRDSNSEIVLEGIQLEIINSMQFNVLWPLDTTFVGQFQIVVANQNEEVIYDFLTVEVSNDYEYTFTDYSAESYKGSGVAVLSIKIENTGLIDIPILETQIDFPSIVEFEGFNRKENAISLSDLTNDTTFQQMELNITESTKSLLLLSGSLQPGEVVEIDLALNNLQPGNFNPAFNILAFSRDQYIFKELQELNEIINELYNSSELSPSEVEDLSNEENVIQAFVSMYVESDLISQEWFNSYISSCPNCLSLPFDFGSPIGTQNYSEISFKENQVFICEINSSIGSPAVNWDYITTESLTIESSVENPFIISLQSVNDFGIFDILDDFNSCNSYQWKVLSSETTIVGYDSSSIIIESDFFINTLLSDFELDGNFKIFSPDTLSLYIKYNGDCFIEGCEIDSDGDLIPDCFDLCPYDPNKTEPGICGCYNEDLDSDDDGFMDCEEICDTDPLKQIPGDCGCNVPDEDFDNDGWTNCEDLCPLDPFKRFPGSCGCGVPDLDSDNDGVPNCIDLCLFDHNEIVPGECGCGVMEIDTDEDGVLDCFDQCPLDPDKIEPGTCGCGISDIDSDQDGTPDCADSCPIDPNKISPGTCGCGTIDIDSDNDGTADCFDECPNDPNKTQPGICGCNISDIDSDGDLVPDCQDGCPNDIYKTEPGACGCGNRDADSDGDGVLDCDDVCPFNKEKWLSPGVCGCDYVDNDADGDGVPNCIDACPTDPLKSISPGTCGCNRVDKIPCVDCNDPEICDKILDYTGCYLDINSCAGLGAATIVANLTTEGTFSLTPLGVLLFTLTVQTCSGLGESCFGSGLNCDEISLIKGLISGTGKGVIKNVVLDEIGYKAALNKASKTSAIKGAIKLSLCAVKKLLCKPVKTSCDPNEIIGPSGNGLQRWITPQDNLSYLIYYENDSLLASAAAQKVEVRLPIDTNMNLYTFQVGDFNFGQFTFTVPEGLSSYSQLLDLTEELGLKVQVTIGVDVTANEAFWIFESLDPFTLLPPYSPDLGFLAINDSLGNGQGYVSFSIDPLNTLQTGDSISALANIFFDINEPILTNTWVNYIDAYTPNSQIDSITPAASSMAINWSAQDEINGSGISHVDIYYKETTATEYSQLTEQQSVSPFYFQGDAGISYDMYTLATDTAGNIEIFDELPTSFVYQGGNNLSLALKVILEGPYDSIANLMTDNIRVHESFPLMEPYTQLGFIHVNGGGETTTPSVLANEGPDAIVDWLFVELRDGTNPTHVIQTHSALLQKDGDIVMSDGVSPLNFSNPILQYGSILVAIKHRCHLGIRNLNPFILSENNGIISFDFTNPDLILYIDQLATTEINGVAVMISGDANGDGAINPVDKNGYWRLENGEAYDYFDSKADFNLDGIVNPVDKNAYWRKNNGKAKQLED